MLILRPAEGRRLS